MSQVSSPHDLRYEGDKSLPYTPNSWASAEDKDSLSLDSNTTNYKIPGNTVSGSTKPMCYLQNYY